MYRNLTQFIELLDKKGDLIRIKEFVDPKLEAAELIDRQAKQPGGGKAILFENTGTGFPILSNFLGSDERIAAALGTDKLEHIAHELKELFTTISGPKKSILDKIKTLPTLSKFASWMPKVKSGKGECQQVVMEQPDLLKLPILTTWPLDGGPFITFPLVHTLKPSTGIRNVGMYRMHVYDGQTSGMHWHRHKTGANHFQEYKDLGQKMPISVVLGGDPVYTYSASAPLPEDIDEYMLAGFLRKKKVELVKCLTNDLHVPADADIVIEGYVDTAEPFRTEGPFGDHTGFYSLKDKYPVFHVTCITHRKNAVYPATLVGIPPMEDVYMAKATEKIFNFPIQMTVVPELLDLHMPIEGVAHNITVVKIDKKYPGQALKTANALWGAGQMMFNKAQIIIDQHQDAEDYAALFQLFLNRADIETDLQFSVGPMDVLDHSSQKFSFGSKIMIDLTDKHAEEEDMSYPNMFMPVEPQLAQITLPNPIVVTGTQNCMAFVNCLKEEITDIKGYAAGVYKQINRPEVNIVLLFESFINIDDLSLISWLSSGNTDPRRDFHFIEVDGKKILVIDVLNKTEKLHGFKRDWPNVVIMNDDTIEQVDKKWDSYGIGEFIASPSLKYKNLFIGDTEVVGEE